MSNDDIPLHIHAVQAFIERLSGSTVPAARAKANGVKVCGRLWVERVEDRIRDRARSYGAG